MGAEKIGDWFQDQQINPLLHKALHGALRAALGALSNLKDPAAAALGGATAAIAELVVENLPDTIGQETRCNIAIMVSAAVALVCKQDVNAAILTATNAVENNNFINIPIPIEAAQLLVDEAKQGANFAMEEVEGAAKVKQDYHNGVDAVFDFLQGQYAGIYGADIIAEIFLPVLVQGMNPALLNLFPGLKGVVQRGGKIFLLVLE
jgi:hypothetical protein